MSESTTSFYYDIAEARLLVGDDAYNLAVAAGTHPNDLPPLKEVLTTDELITLKPGSNCVSEFKLPELPTPLDCHNWNRQDMVTFVSWLGNSVIDSTPTDRLTDDVFTRAYHLGIGPPLKKLSEAGISDLYLEANVHNTHKRGVWDNWTRQDIADYVGEIAKMTPKNRSLRDAINEAARTNKGPSTKVIRRRMGSVGKALEYTGLFDSRRLDIGGYIDWGVKFYLANDGIAPDRAALDYLSPRRLSPSRSAITRNFDSIESFRLEVEPLYLEERERIQNRDSAVFNTVMQSLADGDLPTEITREAHDFKSMARSYGIYMVIEKLLPSMELQRKMTISQDGSVTRMVSSLIRFSEGTITAADIEEAAEMIGVFDYLWPCDSFMQTLRLPQRL